MSIIQIPLIWVLNTCSFFTSRAVFHVPTEAKLSPSVREQNKSHQINLDWLVQIKAKHK